MILTFAISFLAFTKTLLFLRIFSPFAQIMRLSYNVVFAASAFSIFYYMVIVFFAFAYQILGNTTGGHPDIGFGHGEGNDYERFN